MATQSPKTATAETATEAAEKRDAEQLGRQLETIRKDIAALTDLMAEMGTRRKDAASEQLQQKVTELRMRAEAVGAEAAERVGVLGERAQAQMREQPGTTLLIATGIGFLAGLLMARK